MLNATYIDSLPYYNPIDRKTVLILGGCSGIGYYTVLHLYLHGFIIYITGRSKSRVFKCIDELQSDSIRIRSDYTSQTTNSRFLGELHFLQLDLSDLKSVTSASHSLKRLENHLNIFINNLSTNYLPHTITKDGFEIQLQLNYISPFLLITQLLPLLGNGTSKFITTSSPSHYLQFKYFDMNQDFNYKPNVLFNWLRYSKSKVCGIHLVKMLSLRNPEITSLVVDTGFVMNASIFSYLTRLPIIGVLFWCLFQVFGFCFGIDVEQGSYGILKYCLTDVDRKDNGSFIKSNGEVSAPSRVAANVDYAARTWIWTINKLNERNLHIPN